MSSLTSYGPQGFPVPQDVAIHIFSFITKSRDVESARLTCSFFKNNIDFQRAKTIAFVRQFGKISNIEKDTTIDELLDQSRKLKSCNYVSYKQLLWGSSILRFDKKGVPYIQCDKATTRRERRKNKYSLLRGEYQQKIIKKIYELNNQYSRIVKEFYEKEFDADNPLQDYRDRFIRVKRLEKELDNLISLLSVVKVAREELKKDLKLSKKICLDVMSLFHSFEKSVNKDVDLKFSHAFLKEIIITPIIKITINGENVPIQIKSGPALLCDSIIFNIERADIPDTSSIHRILGQFNISKYYLEYSQKQKESTNEHLTCTYFDDRIGRDAITNGFPILKLIFQLAMEILRKEDKRELQISLSKHDFDTFTTLGLVANDERTNDIKQAWRGSREAIARKFLYGGVWLPGRQFDKITIYKTDNKRLRIQFMEIAMEDMQKNETQLDLSLEKWEKKIAKKPLLGHLKGHVLPKYMKHDRRNSMI